MFLFYAILGINRSLYFIGFVLATVPSHSVDGLVRSREGHASRGSRMIRVANDLLPANACSCHARTNLKEPNRLLSLSATHDWIGDK